jgi:hypothetical protein
MLFVTGYNVRCISNRIGCAHILVWAIFGTTSMRGIWDIPMVRAMRMTDGIVSCDKRTADHIDGPLSMSLRV